MNLSYGEDEGDNIYTLKSDTASTNMGKREEEEEKNCWNIVSLS